MGGGLRESRKSRIPRSCDLIGREYAKLEAATVEGFFADKGTHTNAAGSMFNAKAVVSGLRAIPTAPLDPYLNYAGKGGPWLEMKERAHRRLPIAPGDAFFIRMNLQAIEPTRRERSGGSRLLFLDALRAFASLLILWHHFALYPPLSRQAEPLLGPLVHWFSEHARSTQVFFVIGGYVMARGMSGKVWDIEAVGRFLAGRYCRLGIPYLAAIVLAIVAGALGRGWLPENVTGAPPTVTAVYRPRFLPSGDVRFRTPLRGPVVCLHQLPVGPDLRGRALAARHRWPGSDTPRQHRRGSMCRSSPAGFYQPSRCSTSTATMNGIRWRFIFSPTSSWASSSNGRRRTGVPDHVLALSAIDRRRHVSRLALAAGQRAGGGAPAFRRGQDRPRPPAGPKARWIARMGKVSYSLFLVHFPVLVLVAGLWARLGWTSPPAAIAGLLTAFIGSLAVSFAFHRFIESPAARAVSTARSLDHQRFAVENLLEHRDIAGHHSTCATASAAMPSLRPMKPIISLVVALMPTRSGLMPSAAPMFARIASRCGRTLGASATSVESTLMISKSSSFAESPAFFQDLQGSTCPCTMDRRAGNKTRCPAGPSRLTGHRRWRGTARPHPSGHQGRGCAEW